MSHGIAIVVRQAVAAHAAQAMPTVGVRVEWRSMAHWSISVRKGGCHRRRQGDLRLRDLANVMRRTDRIARCDATIPVRRGGPGGGRRWGRMLVATGTVGWPVDVAGSLPVGLSVVAETGGEVGVGRGVERGGRKLFVEGALSSDVSVQRSQLEGVEGALGLLGLPQVPALEPGGEALGVSELDVEVPLDVQEPFQLEGVELFDRYLADFCP